MGVSLPEEPQPRPQTPAPAVTESAFPHGRREEVIPLRSALSLVCS